jgi:hypothetical protein
MDLYKPGGIFAINIQKAEAADNTILAIVFYTSTPRTRISFVGIDKNAPDRPLIVRILTHQLTRPCIRIRNNLVTPLQMLLPGKPR